MSGHSKWSQIKHKKAISDAKKGRLFSKLVREIMVAARAGGATADSNPRLRQALEKAKSIGLPKDNIERAIARASGEGEAALLQEFLYEATTPGGIMILIEGITDNKNRTLAGIKHILAEHRARLAEQGSLIWNFNKLGVIEIALGDNAEKKDEDVSLAAIEAGADDLKKIDGTLLVETAFEKKDSVRKQLEGRGIEVKESSYDYKSRSPLTLAGAERNEADKLLDALAEHDDVQEVYSNIEEDKR